MLLLIQNFLADRFFTWLVFGQLALAAFLVWTIYREGREQRVRLATRLWRRTK